MDRFNFYDSSVQIRVHFVREEKRGSLEIVRELLWFWCS